LGIRKIGGKSHFINGLLLVIGRKPFLDALFKDDFIRKPEKF
jgi:hypothetical protein